jgi:hypothetical protein
MVSRGVISAIQRNAGSMGVRKVQGVLQDFAFLMAVARGARSLVATKVLRVEQHSAKLMEEGDAAKS